KKIKEYMNLRNPIQKEKPSCYGFSLLFGYYHLINKGQLFFDRLRECLSIDMKGWGSLSEKTFREMSEDELKMEYLYNDLEFLFKQQYNGFTSGMIEHLQSVSPEISSLKISKPYKFSIVLPHSETIRIKNTFVDTLEKIISAASNTPTLIFTTISADGYHIAALYYDGKNLSFYDPNIPNQVNEISPEERGQEGGKIIDFLVKHYMTKQGEYVALELFPMMKNPSAERLEALDQAYNLFNEGIDRVTKDELYLRFETAVQAGDLIDLLYWIDRGKEIGSIHDIGTRLFNSALQKGQIKVGKFLIENGVDVNELYSRGNAPLHYAAIYSKLEFAELFLQNGAEVNIQNISGKTTALHLSSDKGDLEMVKLLIKHKADIELEDNKSLFSLFVAAQNGHLSIVELLLEHGAKSDRVGPYGLKPYQVAGQFDHHEISKILLDHMR
ncbi:MAG: ankyrin repeat domain-containing protein, partial [Chlamydiota bacterium]